MTFLKKDNILKQNVIYFINHNFKKTPFISFIAIYSKKENRRFSIMLIYFTNNHMLGLDYVSEFTFNKEKFHTLRDFITCYGTNPNSLKEALLQRIQSNVQIAGYFRNQFGEFYHITEESLDCIRNREDYTLNDADFYFDNALGQVYTDICLKYNKPKKSKKVKEDRFEKMLSRPYRMSKRQNWQSRLSRILFYAGYVQI